MASKTQTNKPHGSLSSRIHEPDWVVVEDAKHSADHDFEIIDAAELRCWCGDEDARRCYVRGHGWPLSMIDQDESCSRKPGEISQKQHQKEIGIISTTRHQTGIDESNTCESQRTKSTTSQNAVHRLILDDSSPLTKLNILTNSLNDFNTNVCSLATKSDNIAKG